MVAITVEKRGMVVDGVEKEYRKSESEFESTSIGKSKEDKKDGKSPAFFLTNNSLTSLPVTPVTPPLQ